MNQIEQRVTRMLMERAAAVTPEPDVDAIVLGRRDSHADLRRRWIVVGTAAAAVSMLLVGAALWMAGADEESVVITSDTPGSDPTPDTGSPDTTEDQPTPAGTSTPPDLALVPTLGFPDDIPDAPLNEGGGYGLILERDGRPGWSGPSGEWVPLVDGLDDAADPSVWTEPLGDVRIIDIDGWAPSAVYIVTCCDPGSTLWRNGAPVGTATRVKYTSHDGPSRKFVTVDDVADTVFFAESGGEWQAGAGGQPVPDIVDATGVEGGLVALIGGPDPHLLMLSVPPSDSFGRVVEDADPPSRVEVPFAEEGPCALVTLDSTHLMVLYGTSDGVDRCIGDRAALIDDTTGELVTALRLPDTSRLLRSNENGGVSFVTPDGAAIEGHFAPRTDGQVSAPVWTTRTTQDALAALPPSD